MVSDQKQEYTLKTGSHTWIDGNTYSVGDKMVLTHEQMERIGKERFEGQTVEAAQANDIEALKEENRKLREQLAQMKSGSAGLAGSAIMTGNEEEDDNTDYSAFLNRSIPDITKSLSDVTSLSSLAAIQAEESKGGQPRVGVLKAIEQRREELS